MLTQKLTFTLLIKHNVCVFFLTISTILLITLKNIVAYAFDIPQQQVEPVVAKSDK